MERPISSTPPSAAAASGATRGGQSGAAILPAGSAADTGNSIRGDEVTELRLDSSITLHAGDTVTITDDTKRLEAIEVQAFGLFRDRTKVVYCTESGAVVGMWKNVLGFGDGVDVRFAAGHTKFFFISCLAGTASGTITTPVPHAQVAVKRADLSRKHVDPASAAVCTAERSEQDDDDDERAVERVVQAAGRIPQRKPGRRPDWLVTPSQQGITPTAAPLKAAAQVDAKPERQTPASGPLSASTRLTKVAAPMSFTVLTLRVYENGRYGDVAHDRVPFRSVTVRPTHKTLDSVISLVTRELSWNTLGRKVECLYAMASQGPTLVTSMAGLREGCPIVATEGGPVVAVPPGSMLHEEVAGRPEALKKSATPVVSKASTMNRMRALEAAAGTTY